MKRFLSLISPKSLTVLTIIVSVTLLTSCNKQDELDNDHMLNLNLFMDTPISRTTTDNIWSGGEQVQVSINDGTAVTFIAAQNGTLTPLNPIYWQNASQNISARAWHPASWTFPADQSGGLQPADFIFASTVTGIMFSNYLSKPLVFQHRLAKITVNLMAGTDISSVAGATVSFFGYTVGSPDTSDTGNGVISGSGNGWITPQNSSDDTYAALLIPRDMMGIPFVKIIIAGTYYLYTPAVGQATLKQGMAYSFNITVHKTRLDVEVVDGIEWSDSSEYDVAPNHS